MKKQFAAILFAGVLLFTGCRNSPPAEISSRPDLFAESETAVTEQTDPPESGQQSSEQRVSLYHGDTVTLFCA